jgi:hypothetical protein
MNAVEKNHTRDFFRAAVRFVKLGREVFVHPVGDGFSNVYGADRTASTGRNAAAGEQGHVDDTCFAFFSNIALHYLPETADYNVRCFVVAQFPAAGTLIAPGDTLKVQIGPEEQ